MSGSRIRSVALALVPGVVVFVCWLVLRGAGDVESFGSVDTYRVVMNVAALGRFFGLFAAVLLVWGLLRARAAPRWVMALALLSGPAVYAVTAVAGVIGYFPIGEALYYGVNPLTIAGIGSQIGWAVLAEMAWRWRGRRRGNWKGAVATPALVAAGVLGFSLLFFTVIYRGGVAFFFVYQQGYEALFR